MEGIITIYPTVKKFILFHHEKLYLESFRGEIKDLFTVGSTVLLIAEDGIFIVPLVLRWK